MKTPTTSKPCRFRRKAATEESTPPDIATKTLFVLPRTIFIYNERIMNYAALDKFIVPAVWIVFAGMCVFFIVISLILNYHWTRYGVSAARLTRIRVVYFSVSAVLTLGMFGFAFLLSR